MSRRVALTVLAPDEVGIIAWVTKAVFGLEGNIDALSQTVLRGQFTLILTVTFPRAVSDEEISGAITGGWSGGRLSVSIQPHVSDEKATHRTADGERFVLTITGDDRPGIVCRITSYLSRRAINIQDLYAHSEENRFLLIGELTIPREQDIHQVQIDLAGLWDDAPLRIALQHKDIFVATNEIDFRHIPTS